MCLVPSPAPVLLYDIGPVPLPERFPRSQQGLQASAMGRSGQGKEEKSPVKNTSVKYQIHNLASLKSMVSSLGFCWSPPLSHSMCFPRPEGTNTLPIGC